MGRRQMLPRHERENMLDRVQDDALARRRADRNRKEELKQEFLELYAVVHDGDSTGRVAGKEFEVATIEDFEQGIERLYGVQRLKRSRSSSI
jgi:hypothetical protein